MWNVLRTQALQIEFVLILESLLWSIESCQNRESADQRHMTVSRTPAYNLLRWHDFEKFSADQLWHKSDLKLRTIYFRKKFLKSSHESFAFAFTIPRK